MESLNRSPEGAKALIKKYYGVVSLKNNPVEREKRDLLNYFYSSAING
jgi:hypothetical protein